MKCPYCGGEMQHGKLMGDARNYLRFEQEGKKYTLGDKLCGVGRIRTGRRWASFQLDADYCVKCKKLVMDVDVGE